MEQKCYVTNTYDWIKIKKLSVFVSFAVKFIK